MFIFRLLAYCFTALFTLTLFWALGWMWFAASIVSMKPYDETVKTDAIVVLTGGDKRVNTGLDLIAADKAKFLFISGVNAKVKPEELTALWDGNKAKVLPRIRLGYTADSTVTNAVETQAWIRENKIQSIRLVTANYHMARAMLLFRQQMPHLKIYRHPVVPGGFEPWKEQFWPLTFSEYNKYLASWLHIDQINKNPSLSGGAEQE